MSVPADLQLPPRPTVWPASPAGKSSGNPVVRRDSESDQSEEVSSDVSRDSQRLRPNKILDPSSDESIASISRKQELAVVADFYKKYHRLRYVVDPEGFATGFGKKFDDDRRAFEALDDASGDTGGVSGKCVWCTVNPDFRGSLKQEHIDVFEQRLSKLFKFKWVRNFWLVFEQRSKDVGKYYGLHVHMLIDRGDYRPAGCKRDLDRVFIGVVGNQKHIDCVAIKDHEIKIKMEYMRGNKKDKSKCAADVAMRKEFELNAMYTKDNWYDEPEPRLDQDKSGGELKSSESDSESSGSSVEFASD